MTSEETARVEAEALAAAVGWLNEHREGMSPAFSRQIIRECLLPYASTPRGMIHIIEWAREGDEDAHRILTDLAGEFLNRGMALPAFLATYVAEGMYGASPARRGKKKKDKLLRDILIAGLVVDLATKFRLKPTRSNARSVRASACSIVAVALGRTKIASVGEKAIENIYNRWKDVGGTNPEYWQRVIASENVLKLSPR